MISISMNPKTGELYLTNRDESIGEEYEWSMGYEEAEMLRRMLDPFVKLARETAKAYREEKERKNARERVEIRPGEVYTVNCGSSNFVIHNKGYRPMFVGPIDKRTGIVTVTT